MSIEQFETESMFGVLVYLFERHIYNDTSTFNPTELTDELELQGFSLTTIYRALDWLDDLAFTKDNLQRDLLQPDSFRILTEAESNKITPDAYAFIMQLLQNKFLTPQTRELTLSQIMKLDHNVVNLEQTKWVVLMVLFNQDDQEKALQYFEYINADNKKEIN